MRISIIALAAIFLAACTTPPASLTLAAQTPSPPSLAPASSASMPPEATDPASPDIRVMLAPGNDPKSGRLIVIATPVKSVPEATSTPYPRYLPGGQGSYIAAQEAPFLTPAQATRINADQLAYPLPLSRIPEGARGEAGRQAGRR